MAVVERSGPLSVSQEWPWFKSMSVSPFCYSATVHTGLVSIECMKRNISVVLNRHEALRTRFVSDETGTPSQEVLRLPSIDPFIVVPTGALEESELQAMLAERLATTSAIIVLEETGGQASRGVLHVHKAALDGASMQIVKSEIRDMFSPSGNERGAVLRPAEWHPIDQALHERSGRGGQSAERLTRYWKERIASESATTIPFRWDPSGEEHDVIATVLRDGAILPQLKEAAASCNATVPELFMSVVALVTSAWTRNDDVVVSSVFSGRHAGRVRGSVGHYSMDVEVHLRLDESWTFAELVESVRTSMLRAYRMSAFSTLDLMAERARASSSRALMLSSSLHLNYIDYSGSDDGAEASEAHEIHHKRVPGGYPYPFIDVRRRDSECVVVFGASGQLASESDAVDYLERCCRVVEVIAQDQQMRVGALLEKSAFRGRWDETGWQRRRGAWIDTKGMRNILESHSYVDSSRVFISEEGVTVCVAVGEGTVDSRELVGRLRVAASWNCGISVPDSIILRAGEPSESERLASWLEDGLIIDQEDYKAKVATPSDRVEAAFAHAFSQLHPGVPVDMDLSYALLGGDFRRIHAMIQCLTGAGVQGLHWRDLVGMASLRDLARHCRGPQASPAVATYE